MKTQKEYNSAFDAGVRKVAKLVADAVTAAQERANKEKDFTAKNNQLLGIIMVTQEIDRITSRM